MMKQAIKVKHVLWHSLLWGFVLCMAVIAFTGQSLTVEAASYSSISANKTLANGDTISGTVSSCTVTVPAGATVTVTGQITISGTVNLVGGGKLVRSGSFTSASMIKVSSGATLNIGTSAGTTGVTVDGGSVNVSVNGGGIYSDGGTVNLYNGATVTNHYVVCSPSLGGGIYMASGILNMYEGAFVTDNKSGVTSTLTCGGGGIALFGDAVFNMSGGTISGNSSVSTAAGGGGGGIYNTGTFNMSGGTIANNISGRNGGAVHNAGVKTDPNAVTTNAVMTMTGGLITGNSAVWGGGIEIMNKAGLTISGGKINSNTCTSGGGGIELDSAGYSGYLKVSGSAQITGNSKNGLQDNVYIDKTITVAGNFTGSIGITHETASVNTTGGIFGTASGSYTGMENFFCDGKTLVGVLSGTNVKWKSSTISLTGVTLSTNSPIMGTVITTTLAPGGGYATYQWYRNTSSLSSGGTLIVGATDSTYTPVSADAGKYLYVIANGTGGSTGIVKSAATTTAVQLLSAAAPSFSVAAGTYISTQNVTISCATAEATIYYTTDGSTPTSGSTKYTGAIAVSAAKTIKAIAVKADYGDSEVTSAVYTFRSITATPYTGTYDGNEHNAVTMTGTVIGDTVTYSTNGTTFTADCPKYKNAGSNPVYIKVTNTSQGTWESGLKTAEISRAAGSITITGDPTKTYDGSVVSVSGSAISKNGTGEVTFTYYSDNAGTIGTVLSGAPSAVGTYWVKAVMAQDTNYTKAEAAKKFSITSAVISGITVTPYTGTYDAAAHNAVTVTGTAAGDTVTYSTNGTDFSSACPKYTDAGSYSVYVKVSRTGHTDWQSGSKAAEISRAAGSITITGDPTKTYDGSVVSVSGSAISKNGTGEVTFTYYSDNAGTIGTVLSGAPSAVGTYWVKAVMAQDTNYTKAEAAKKFSIENPVYRVMVTVNGSEGAGYQVYMDASNAKTSGWTYTLSDITGTYSCPAVEFGSYYIYVCDSSGNVQYISAQVSVSATAHSTTLALYTINYAVNGGSTVSAQTLGNKLPDTLPATTKDGYDFAGWYTNASLTMAATAGTAISAPTSLYAGWTAHAYSITVQSGGNGTASANVTTAASGSAITLSVSPDGGYRLKEWQVVSGGVTITGNTFTMPDNNVTVKAVFELIPVTTYTVAVNNGSGDGTYAAGTTVNITADSPESGKQFKEWTIVSGGAILVSNTSASTSFVMPGNAVEITAAYEDIAAGTYTITVQIEGDGTASAGVATAASGSAITLSAIPDSGYSFKEWQVVSGGVTITGNTFTMPGNNVTVKAIFEVIPVTTYTVTVNNGFGGGAYAAGVTVNISADSPESGKHFKEWTIVSGGAILVSNTSASTSFAMPGNAVEITATYEDNPADTYSITVQSQGNGVASANVTTAASGSAITLIAAPDSGYSFKEWQVVSGEITITGNTFTMPSGDVTVKAVFEAIPVTTYSVGGTIKDNNGSAVYGATVILTNTADASKTFIGTTDANGNYTITSVPNGSYAITVTKSSITTGSGSVTVNDSNAFGGSGDITVVLLTPTPSTPTPSTPTSNGNSSSVTPAQQTETVTVDVKSGISNEVASTITVKRTIEADGRKTDTATYEEEKAKETIKKLEEDGKDLARIVITDEMNEISETNIKIPATSLGLMASADINLEVDTDYAIINIPKETLQKTDGESEKELYFRLIPVKADKEKEQVIERAKQEATVMSIVQDGTIAVIGTPVTIETNMPQEKVEITLPLNAAQIPEDTEEREEFLSKLAVYIEHSDGEKRLVKGEIVNYSDGGLGIRFTITKFSTFTILQSDSFLEKSTECEIIKVKSPSGIIIEGTKLTVTVKNAVTKLYLDLISSKNAVWKLYSNKACTKEILNNALKLTIGKNTAYIKVTAEDGVTEKVYRITVTRKNKVVFIATKNDFSDAYAGEVLAEQLGGKVVRFGYTDKEVQKAVNYITKNFTTEDTIYLFGLEQAVRTDLETILKKKGYKYIIRIGGADKYETAQMIAEEINPEKGTKIVLINGEAEPEDAEINDVCAENGYPILYVKTDSLTEYTRTALKKIKPSEIYLVGDRTQISNKVVKELQSKFGMEEKNIIRIKSNKD